MAANLLSPNALLTAIINQLSLIPPLTTTGLKTLPPPHRDLFVLAHCLLPSIFLPALDLLDRNLVNHVVGTGTYYIRSSSSVTTAASSAGGKSSASNIRKYNYEVRPFVWHCTCIAFTFSTFLGRDMRYVPEEAAAAAAAGLGDGVGEDEGEWRWGGVVRKDEVAPLCKHLIACVLAERCPKLVGSMIVERELSREERAELAVLWD